MPKNTTHSAELLALYLLNTNAAGIGDATGLRGSSTAGSVYVSLHSADPAGGNQSTNELTYTSYARVAVVRSASGWEDISGNGTTLANVAELTFPTNTGTAQTATHFGIGDASSGTGKLRYYGPLQDPVEIPNGGNRSFLVHQLAVSES